VAGGDEVRLSGAGVGFGAVVLDHVHIARHHDADMPVLAAVGADDGLDAFRPAPARLQRHPCRLHVAELDDVDLRLVWATTLVRLIETLVVHAEPFPRERCRAALLDGHNV